MYKRFSSFCLAIFASLLLFSAAAEANIRHAASDSGVPVRSAQVFQNSEGTALTTVNVDSSAPGQTRNIQFDIDARDISSKAANEISPLSVLILVTNAATSDFPVQQGNESQGPNQSDFNLRIECFDFSNSFQETFTITPSGENADAINIASSATFNCGTNVLNEESFTLTEAGLAKLRALDAGQNLIVSISVSGPGFTTLPFTLSFRQITLPGFEPEPDPDPVDPPVTGFTPLDIIIAANPAIQCALFALEEGLFQGVTPPPITLDGSLDFDEEDPTELGDGEEVLLVAAGTRKAVTNEELTAQFITDFGNLEIIPSNLRTLRRFSSVTNDGGLRGSRFNPQNVQVTSVEQINPTRRRVNFTATVPFTTAFKAGAFNAFVRGGANRRAARNGQPIDPSAVRTGRTLTRRIRASIAPVSDSNSMFSVLSRRQRRNFFNVPVTYVAQDPDPVPPADDSSSGDDSSSN